MQNKSTEHKRRALYAIKRGNRAVKNNRKSKILYDNNDK